jgi:undecaprenyl diphosphate synthase
LPLLAGHHKGAERIEPLVAYAAKRGISHITFWSFSSENWERGEKEVGFLMRVFREFIKSSVVNRMMEKGVRVKVIGDIESFPEDIVRGVGEIVERSKDNKIVTAVFALNYGGRKDILRAVKGIVEARIKGNGVSDVDEKTFASYLYTADLPDPDMIVRTGGEQRISGFLPWQAVYSELYFTDKYWPDFDEKAFEEAIEEYAQRERRFGR